MAKKKKGARAGASKRARKAAASRRPTAARTKKPKARAPRRAALADTGGGVHPGLSDPDKVDLRYLNSDIDLHIARLKTMGDSARVTEALRALQGAQATLKSGCAPTMVIP